MLLARIPEDGPACPNSLALAVGAAHPTGAVDDDEELRNDGGVTCDYATGSDLDHHDMSCRGKASYPRADTSGRGHLAFAA